jgi:predicted  nucleic acid-binding Zn-ribbon protein
VSVESEKRLDDLEKALEETLEERNRLWAKLNELHVDQRELEHLRKELKTVHDSPMWKLTGYLKRLRHVVGKGLHRLRAG